MPSSLSTTDVAFAMIGVMQGVLALVWLLGSGLAGEMRRASLHWAAFAGLSAVSFALLTLALHRAVPLQAEVLRAAGNLCGIVAMIALQRGIWLFVDQPLRGGAHLLALGVAVAAAFIGLTPRGGALRVSLNSGLLTLLAAGMARDLYRHANDALHLRRPWLMALPLVAAAAGFAFRGLEAALWPATVASQMTTDSILNVASSVVYVVIALTFHALLMTLVVTRLLADLRHRSRHDGLTGLLNRRAIEEAMQAQMQRSRRNGETFSVLMFDLDHFKAINDRFGHVVGDRALRHAAVALKAGLRQVDSLARIGGEEFLALMPGASLAASRPIAERLRLTLEAQPLGQDGGLVALSVSIGLAQWTDTSEDASRLLARADDALYQAKLQGRNRVVAALPTSLARADSDALVATPAPSDDRAFSR
jgi:diguanylate cyclase (GGDEF)-like protein